VKTQTEQLTLRIPKELLAKLTKLAKQERKARSLLVRAILEKAVKHVGMLALLAVMVLVGTSAQAKDQRVSVAVLSAQSRQWDEVRHVPGSPGTTNTDCDISGSGRSATCTSTTTGSSSGYDRVRHRTMVTVMLKMPDGSTIQGQCTTGVGLLGMMANCLEPPVGPYQAYVHGHDVHLLVPSTGSPRYNKDGTIKKPGKTSWTEVRFSW